MRKNQVLLLLSEQFLAFKGVCTRTWCSFVRNDSVQHDPPAVSAPVGTFGTFCNRANIGIKA